MTVQCIIWVFLSAAYCSHSNSGILLCLVSTFMRDKTCKSRNTIQCTFGEQFELNLCIMSPAVVENLMWIGHILAKLCHEPVQQVVVMVSLWRMARVIPDLWLHFPITEHHCTLAGTKSYCWVTRGEHLARNHYTALKGRLAGHSETKLQSWEIWCWLVL